MNPSWLDWLLMASGWLALAVIYGRRRKWCRHVCACHLPGWRSGQHYCARCGAR